MVNIFTLSAFFFTLICSSSSSSTLPVEATLESALNVFPDDAPTSNVELGVAENGLDEIVLTNIYMYAIFYIQLFGVLLLSPLEFDVESGISSDGSSQP